MWLPLEESHEVTGFVRAVGGERHWGGEGHCRGVRHCRGEGHCGGEGQGRERDKVSTQQALHLYPGYGVSVSMENQKMDGHTLVRPLP